MMTHGLGQRGFGSHCQSSHDDAFVETTKWREEAVVGSKRADRMSPTITSTHFAALLLENAIGTFVVDARFLETIVSARKVKMHLVEAEHKETALILWMKTTFQDYLSIMPLFFDIIHSFATPLYGFDQQILLEATQNERTFMNDRKGVVDLDHIVVDFLRRHEKAGGNAMTVAIVLDTEGLVDNNDDENQAPNKPSSALQPTSPPARETQPRHAQLHRIELGFVLRGKNRPSQCHQQSKLKT
jgi:hypothetical protein